MTQHQDPNTRYIGLPDYVRAFLDELTEEEVELLRDSIRWQRNTLTVLRFMKWVIATAVVAFTTVAALGDSATKMLNNLKIWAK